MQRPPVPARGGHRPGRGRSAWAPAVHQQVTPDLQPALSAEAFPGLETPPPTPLTGSPGENSFSGPSSTEHSPEGPSVKPSAASFFFPKRKGFGKEGRPIEIVANYFQIVLPTNNIYHYDVEIGSVRAQGNVQPVISKNCKRRVFQLLAEQHRPALNGNLPVFDGQKNMYTRKPLGFQKMSFDVTMPEEGRDRPEVFRVSVQFAATLDLDLLRQLYNKQVTTPEVPQAVVQALDIILRYGPSTKCAVVGRSIFKLPVGEAAIGGGLELWHGYHASIRPGQWKPFVNVNTLVTAFYESGPLLTLIGKILGDRGRDLDINSMRTLSPAQVIKLNEKLRRLKVFVTHLPYRRKYTIGKVTVESANQIEFGDPPVTVAKYFASKYGRLQFPHLPCIEVGSDKKSYIPVEVCHVVEGQHYRRELDESQTSAVIRKASVPPHERFQKIQEDVRGCIAAGEPYLSHFGIRISEKPLQLSARVLPAPQVIYKDEKPVSPNNGAWELQDNQFIRPASMTCWTIVNASRRCTESELRKFVNLLLTIGRRMGMTMSEPAGCSEYRPPSDITCVLSAQREKFSNLQIVFVVLEGDGKCSPLYSTLKRAAELDLGMMTQCVREETITKKCNHATVGNVLKKVNAKLGGTNNTIPPAVRTIIFKKPVMVMGADVTHPAPTEMNRPSVAALVASVDRLAFRYIATFRIQKHDFVAKARLEVIEEMKNMAKELLLGFYRVTNCAKPEKILCYRDGVGESQFSQVQQHEVAALRAACTELEVDYQPAITFVAVQKRHHTRFMPKDRKDGCGKCGNVPPGTIVDTTITHPVHFDFFLCSHFGIQGTSRPTHYFVLWDDNSFDADALQRLTYGLCHTYARCTRSVSIPTPVYYAHHATKRAKSYLDASYRSSSNGPLPPTTFLDRSVRVCKVIENKMFFI